MNDFDMISVSQLKSMILVAVLWSSHTIAQDNSPGRKLIIRLEAMLDEMEWGPESCGLRWMRQECPSDFLSMIVGREARK